jgi:excinuclease UvrABC helicase subunit UvrB
MLSTKFTASGRAGLPERRGCWGGGLPLGRQQDGEIILDADKEGFLRNRTSLIQAADRAVRHLAGECVLFCDVVTDSIQSLLDVSNHRRTRQQEYNQQHGITPQGVKRALQQSLHTHEYEPMRSTARSCRTIWKPMTNCG